ncbi:probable threonine protease PRSS50 [Perognathus longimembris pacificus]|uniref:probable threonine protease PRSS50 n=1 Tax=Perognathus longimembris pacificus TaxID=214514 RepID=UPI00201973A5|nr:probable threonine protease PRSS50 [Perognathus longimembris pacificus]
MEPRYGTRDPPSPAHREPPAPHARFLLLVVVVLLLRWPAAWPPAPPAPPPAAACAPNASCAPPPPRAPQEASTPAAAGLRSTARAHSPRPSCGFSYERDTTLRDPEAMAKRWPWMVSVRANSTHVCAGTIIASQWVLTAGHCLTQPDMNYTVRVGSPWLDEVTEKTVDLQVLQVIVHRRFRPARYWSWVGTSNNIGLLKLQRPLKYDDHVWPICLPGLEFEVEDKSVCAVTGWGYPRAVGALPQFRTIQEREVVILNSQKCEDFYHRSAKIPSLVRIITPQMICVSDINREKFCYETTGEPLACSSDDSWYLVGLVSWGAGCHKTDSPPIFLKVSAYQSWIWDRMSGQPLALPAPSRALFLALPLSLGLLEAL